MPEKKTVRRARVAARQGKAPTTQAGEFVREEMEHIREGRHGARSAKQAIAIGLSKARRAGVKLPARGRKKAAQGSAGRGPMERVRSALKAVRTKGRQGLKRAARKAARTRARRAA